MGMGVPPGSDIWTDLKESQPSERFRSPVPREPAQLMVEGQQDSVTMRRE